MRAEPVIMRSSLIALSSAAVAAAFIVAACSSSDNPPTGDDGTNNGGPVDGSAVVTLPSTDGGTSTTTDSGATDAAVDSGPPGKVDCTTSTQTGDIVQAIGELGNLPDGRGGTIPAGTYTLTAVNEYAGTSADQDGGDDGVTESETDDYSQKTIALSGNGVFHFIEATGHGGTVGAPTVAGGTYTVTTDSLVLTSGCGGATETIPYFFSGRNLYLYRVTAGSPSLQEHYVSP